MPKLVAFVPSVEIHCRRLRGEREYKVRVAAFANDFKAAPLLQFKYAVPSASEKAFWLSM